MKKVTAVLLAALILITCVCLSGCGLILDYLDEWLFGEDYDYTAPSDHVHQFDSYFNYTQCKVDGCTMMGRKGGENTFSKQFVYTLTATKIAQINSVYDQMLAQLGGNGSYEVFNDLYGQYVEFYNYVSYQYQVSSVLCDVERSSTNVNNYTTATKLYNEMYANYYGLYKLVYNSNLRSDFYQGWTEDEINEALYYAELYGGTADNNNAVDEILAEYDNYLDEIGGRISTTQQLNVLGEMYGRLVEANNAIATAAHYDNYMDYAYAEEYSRDYAPSQVAATMRDFVKRYVAPIYVKVASRNETLFNVNFNATADSNFYFGILSDSLFTAPTNKNFGRVRTAVNYVGQYLDYINRPTSFTNGAAVDFGAALEDLFKKGNYFTGDYQGAYTWWIRNANAPILYFGQDYDTAFTFVHEFGHYYENVYNGNLTLSYDHEETHSQGNEMLFLAWLAQHKQSGVTNGLEMVEVYQLADMLGNIVIATAVDEFEQAAYTNTYNGAPISVSYGELFKQILRSYKGVYNGVELTAADFLNSNYWGYVAFDSAAYYISYAMSALPSIELYVKARTDGIYAARNSYVKLFTFSNDSRFVTTDGNGKKRLTEEATYQAILNYCGLQGPFQQGLYTDLLSYFNGRNFA